MRTASALVLVQLLSVVAACSGRDGVPLDWPEARFSPSAWREAKPEARYSLVRDLIDSRRLDGLKRDQVVGLLGPPSYECTQPECHYLDYVVKSAAQGEYTFNSVYALTVQFDKQGKVSAARIRAD